MKVWINYTTFGRDLEWTRYSLESIRKYATGFSGIQIVVPTWDLDKFKQFERYSTPECPVVISRFLEYPGRGFVHHLAMKCYADVFSPEADYILHMDPDCLFTEKVTPEDYFVDGKPVLLIEPYAVLKKKEAGSAEWNRGNWQETTEYALRFTCTHETMCRHPAVHHKWVYKGVREYIEGVHKAPFVDFVVRQKNGYPQGFGEFNTIGAFVLKFHKDDYHLIDREDKGEANDPKPKLAQLWSHGGVNKSLDKIKKILA